jgi:hypothetical protein
VNTSTWLARLRVVWAAYREPVSIGVGARVGLGLLAVLAALYLPGLAPGGTAPYHLPPQPAWWDRLLGVWAHWDGLWYLQIATVGYRPDDGTTAFLPLYPWLVGGLGTLLGGRHLWAGVILSAGCFLAALALIYDLVRYDYPLMRPHETAAGLPTRTVLYLATFPTAFFFWAVYSESLFLLLAVGTLYAARRGHPWIAAACLSGALWTRPFGIVLILPLIWEFVLASRSGRAQDDPRRRVRDWLALGLPVVAVGALLAWSRLALGNPLAFVATQAEWNRRFSWPWETVVYAWNEAARTPFSFQVESQSWTYFATLILFGVLTVASWRLLRGPHSLYLTLGVLFPLFSGTPLNPLLSFSRFVIVLFPAFLVLAFAGRFRPLHYGILLTGALLLALYFIRFANWFWVA